VSPRFRPVALVRWRCRRRLPGPVRTGTVPPQLPHRVRSAAGAGLAGSSTGVTSLLGADRVADGWPARSRRRRTGQARTARGDPNGLPTSSRSRLHDHGFGGLLHVSLPPTTREALPVDPTTTLIAVVFGVRLALLGALALRLRASARRHRDQLDVVTSLASQLPSGTVLKVAVSHNTDSRFRICTSGAQYGRRSDGV
jgi:hypothetical protein